MALAGCTAIQIAAVTGHSSASISQILSMHYIGAPAALAEIVMEKVAAASSATDLALIHHGILDDSKDEPANLN
jgi:hypothetical protein